MQNEFSRTVSLEDVKNKSFSFKNAAKTDECAAIAKRLNVENIHSLQIEGEVTYDKKSKIYTIQGTLDSQMERMCSVTLDSFAETVSFDFKERLILEKDFHPEEYEDMESWNIPEVFSGETLDYGEIITQILSLNLDPYPRKEGVEVDPKYKAPQHAQNPVPTRKPFEVLEKMKKKSNDQ